MNLMSDMKLEKIKPMKYKRQIIMPKEFNFLTKLPLTYMYFYFLYHITNLDVYKRQAVHRRWAPIVGPKRLFYNNTSVDIWLQETDANEKR